MVLLANGCPEGWDFKCGNSHSKGMSMHNCHMTSCQKVPNANKQMPLTCGGEIYE